MQTARQLGAERTYTVGMGHSVTNDDWVRIGEAVGGRKDFVPKGKVKKALDLIEEGDEVWIRPAIDGLRVFVTPNGVTDDEYPPANL